MSTQDKLAEALLPCPFCGSKAAMRITHGEYFVTCTRKGVCYGYHNPDQRDKDGHFMHGFMFAQDAIDMWNKRAHAAEAAHEGSLLTGTTPDGKHYGLRGSKESVDTISDMLIIAEAAQARAQSGEWVGRKRKGHTEWRQGTEKDGGGSTNYVEPVWVWDEPELFDQWMDHDWPLWRNDPDNPNVARLRRMYEMLTTAPQSQAAEPVAWGKFVNDGGPMQGELYEFAKTKFEVDVLINPVNDNGKFMQNRFIFDQLFTAPNKTLDNPPQQFQRVLYWFEPFQKWYLGHYVDGSFCSYSGFCDHYDAPYWLPLPPNPKQ